MRDAMVDPSENLPVECLDSISVVATRK